MKRIALIGCTGSVGRQALEVAERYPDLVSVSALVCGKNAEKLSRLAEKFHPKYAVCAENGYPVFEDILSDCDLVLNAASGFAGLKYTLLSVAAGKSVALANKESLVVGGELVIPAARKSGAEIIPVDSEHSAIFQALGCRRGASFSRLVLTASGGPFRTYPKERLARVTAADALKHPTWKMGPKVTVDSATLLNKGYEVIEAKWLYDADFSKIEAVVHPESIVHSLVYFRDGAAIAQLGYPDMKLPIQFALTYPDRFPCMPALDLAEIGALHFERLSEENFPCYGLALAAGKAGGTATAVLNAAAEIGVAAFLAGRISFPQIAETIENALARVPRTAVNDYGDLEEADRRAREEAKRSIYGK